MPNGEHIAVPVNDESLELMLCEPTTQAVEGDVCIEDVEFAEEVDHNEFEVVEIYEDQKLIRFPDGMGIWYHVDTPKKEILDHKAFTDSLGDPEEYYVNEFRQTLSEQERVPAQMITPQPNGYTLIEE